MSQEMQLCAIFDARAIRMTMKFSLWQPVPHERLVFTGAFQMICLHLRKAPPLAAIAIDTSPTVLRQDIQITRGVILPVAQTLLRDRLL